MSYNLFGDSVLGQLGNAYVNDKMSNTRVGSLADYMLNAYKQPQSLNTGTPAIGQQIMPNATGTTEMPPTVTPVNPFQPPTNVPGDDTTKPPKSDNSKMAIAALAGM